MGCRNARTSQAQSRQPPTAETILRPKPAETPRNRPFCDGRHGGLRLCVPTCHPGPVGADRPEYGHGTLHQARKHQAFQEIVA